MVEVSDVLLTYVTSPETRIPPKGQFRFGGKGIPKDLSWVQLLCLQLEASYLQWSFFSYSPVWELFYLRLEFFPYNWSFFPHNWIFFAYNGKVPLRSTFMDCK